LVGEAYIIGGAEAVTIREYFLSLAQMTGRERLPSVPGWLAIALAGLLELGSRVSGQPPSFTRGAVRGTMVHATYRIDKARTELGFVPQVEFRTGLEQVRRKWDASRVST
jgi:nucleoside-diphosphate-sugar epimerase